MESTVYTNQHLREVVCGFNFSEKEIIWDSTYFGQYFERIRGLGFNTREERPGIQIDFGDIPVDGNAELNVSAQKVESTMLFKNEARGWAISLGKDHISFHIVKGYDGWENFIANLIAPGLEAYCDLGLFSGKVKNTLAYLNQFSFSDENWMENYFTFLKPIGTTFGVESNTTIQRTFYYRQHLMLLMRLNTSLSSANNSRIVNLECGSMTGNFVVADPKLWRELISQTHEPIGEFFNSLITNNLKSSL